MWKKEVEVDFFVNFFNFMGLGYFAKNRKKNCFALFLFFIALPFHVGYLIFLTTTTNNFVNRARIVQTIPLLVGITINAFNVKWKFHEIKLLLETISKMTGKIKSQKVLNETQSEKKKIVNFFSILCGSALIGTQIASLVQKQLFIPTWTPEFLAGHDNYVFYFHWTWETLLVVYSSFLSLIIDFLLLFSLSSLKGFAKHVSEDIDENFNLKTRKMELLKRLREYYELKM